MSLESRKPADEHILILHRRGLGECPRSRVIEEAFRFEGGTVLSDHSLPSIPTISGKHRLT